MKRTTVAIVLSMWTIMSGTVLFSTPAITADEVEVYLKTESFTWKEFNDNGAQLLKETGVLYSLGGLVKSDITKSLTFKGKSELFGGRVDYDGQTWGGTPVETNTDYFGFKTEGDVSWKFMERGKSFLRPFAGLGYRGWQRDLKSTDSAIGYRENWRSLYVRLGVRGDYVFIEQLRISAETGIKLPIYNENEVDYLGSTVKPGTEASVFAEVGLKWAMLKVNVFYEGMRFSKSDPVAVNGFQILQPESKADMLGVNIGMVFQIKK